MTIYFCSLASYLYMQFALSSSQVFLLAGIALEWNEQVIVSFNQHCSVILLVLWPALKYACIFSNMLSTA